MTEPVRVGPTKEPRRAPEGCAFSAWLWRQRRRPDPIGQLANVIAHDPFWQGADSREYAVAHLSRYGASSQVQRLMGRAWDEFAGARAAVRRKAGAKRKRVKAKLARRKNRPGR